MQKSLAIIGLIAISVGFLFSANYCKAQNVEGDALPRLLDSRLTLTLFAEDPEIVTPIGLAVDENDVVFVIESHTHLPPSDYKGPKSDRIKVFRDLDRDGRSDSQEVFADGLKNAMNLAFSPSGDLYVVCAREVVRFGRRDGQLRSDNRTQVLRLNTDEKYAHNCLLGITFSATGEMFVARGNTGSAYYECVGTDGTIVAGYGDGGSVIVCNSDGGRLREYATGFWNPFDLKFDDAGHLLLVDNDPDARGPNRLVNVVEHGDYGYKSLYGGGGNHPFQGWDGSLPGTLPYVAGCGEAPSGIIDARYTSFPRDYDGSVLVTIWNENSIERFDLQGQDGWLTGNKSLLASGAKDFRPVALATDSRGNLYISDWVLVDYPNHGRGKIWRIAYPSNGAEPALQPQDYFKPRTQQKPVGELGLEQRLASSNPFVAHQATMELAKSPALARKMLKAREPAKRRAALLALKHADASQASLALPFLSDPDQSIRQTALRWAGESLQLELRSHLDTALVGTSISAETFTVWYAAVCNLQSEFVSSVRNRTEAKSNRIRPKTDDSALIQVAENNALQADVRALAVNMLSLQAVEESPEFLFGLLSETEPDLMVACLGRLAELPSMQVDARFSDILRTLSETQTLDESVRLSAIAGMRMIENPNWDRLLNLLFDTNSQVRYAAARTLRVGAQKNANVRRLLLSVLARIEDRQNLGSFELGAAIEEQLKIAAYGEEKRHQYYIVNQPVDPSAWRAIGLQAGDAQRGREVFHSQQASCASCHCSKPNQVTLGPDLRQISRSKTREQIIESVIDPSAEFPPQYQAWQVIDSDGKLHRGLQLDHKAGGAIEMISDAGEKLRFEASDIDTYQASPNSLMPSGLHLQLSPTEFMDLIEYMYRPNR